MPGYAQKLGLQPLDNASRFPTVLQAFHFVHLKFMLAYKLTYME